MEENMPTIKHIVKVVGVSALIIFILAFCGDNMQNSNSSKGDKGPCRKLLLSSRQKMMVV